MRSSEEIGKEVEVIVSLFKISINKYKAMQDCMKIFIANPKTTDEQIDRFVSILQEKIAYRRATTHHKAIIVSKDNDLF